MSEWFHVQSLSPAISELTARLRAAREAQSASADDLAHRLRVPAQVIRQIEHGDLAALGATVYRRGYLLNYARAVGVPTGLVEAALAELNDVPPAALAAPLLLPPERSALDRYSGVASYLVGTAIVVVSLVWSFQQARVTGARTVAITPPALPSSAAATAPAIQAPGVKPVTPESSAPEPSFSPGPVVASMTPVFSPLPTAAVISRELTLNFSEETWLEVKRLSDGKRLEYSLVGAGSSKRFALEGGLKVVIGNVVGVSATVGAQPFDLGSVTRGNVASFELPPKP
jgi:cytoskeleton protein RodZ